MPYKRVMKRLAPLRLAGAVLILGAALAGAAILHGLAAAPTCPGICPHGWTAPTNWRPWADPSALAVLLIGVAGAAVVLLNAHRRRS
jgi:hypothetical protein